MGVRIGDPRGPATHQTGASSPRVDTRPVLQNVLKPGRYFSSSIAAGQPALSAGHEMIRKDFDRAVIRMHRNGYGRRDKRRTRMVAGERAAATFVVKI
jgi:hypothetical protein